MICEHLGLQYYTLCVEQQLTGKKNISKTLFLLLWKAFIIGHRHLSFRLFIFQHATHFSESLWKWVKVLHLLPFNVTPVLITNSSIQRISDRFHCYWPISSNVSNVISLFSVVLFIELVIYSPTYLGHKVSISLYYSHNMYELLSRLFWNQTCYINCNLKLEFYISIEIKQE